MRKKRKKTGLALGGGAALGAAHIGVLRALEEKNVPIDCIAGTSIGAFVAALYAFGKKVDDIERIAHSMKWINISGLSLSQFGLLSNEKLGDILEEEIGDVSFKDARIPLAMIATDIGAGEKVILTEGSVIKAMQASTCLPGIFIPVTIEDRMLVDGGILENVPVTPLKNMDAKRIIAVDLVSNRKFTKPRNIIGILMNAFYLGFTYSSKQLLKQIDYHIKPELDRFSVADTKKIDELIQAGYDAAVDSLGSAKFQS